MNINVAEHFTPDLFKIEELKMNWDNYQASANNKNV